MIQLIMFLAILVPIGTISYGIKFMKSRKKGSIKTALLTSLSLFSLTVIAFCIAGFTNPVMAAEGANTAAAAAQGSAAGLKYIAAALSTGFATIGTGMAVGSVGSSAIGAVSEDPAILGKTLIFVGMAEGIAIYGMIISILILFM